MRAYALLVAAALAVGCTSRNTAGDGATDVRDGAANIDGAADSAADTGPLDRPDITLSDAAPDAPADVAPADRMPPRDGGCGTCPTGFTCRAAGYCANANGVPAFDNVYVIMMENHSLSTIQGNASAAYINSLMTTFSYASNFWAVHHPSLPNYLALVSGNHYGVSCDCGVSGSACSALNCNFVFSSCNCAQSAMHLGDQFEAAGIPWRAYGEDMGTACNTSPSGNYVIKHIPFLYFDNVRTNAARCAAHVVDYASNFGPDNTAGSYRFSMITPNQCHNMHDRCPLTTGDAVQQGNDWLAAQVPSILAGPGFGPAGRDVLFIVWDEEDVTTYVAGSSAAAPMIAISPLVRAGFATAVRYDHYALLATIEDSFGLSRLGSAATAPVIGDIWR